MVRGWNQMIFKVPSQLKSFYDSVVSKLFHYKSTDSVLQKVVIWDQFFMQFNCPYSRCENLWKKQVIGIGKASPCKLNPTMSLLGVISCLSFHARN